MTEDHRNETEVPRQRGNPALPRNRSAVTQSRGKAFELRDGQRPVANPGDPIPGQPRSTDAGADEGPDDRRGRIGVAAEADRRFDRSAGLGVPQCAVDGRRHRVHDETGHPAPVSRVGPVCLEVAVEGPSVVDPGSKLGIADVAHDPAIESAEHLLPRESGDEASPVFGPGIAMGHARARANEIDEVFIVAGADAENRRTHRRAIAGREHAASLGRDPEQQADRPAQRREADAGWERDDPPTKLARETSG